MSEAARQGYKLVELPARLRSYLVLEWRVREALDAVRRGYRAGDRRFGGLLARVARDALGALEARASRGDKFAMSAWLGVTNDAIGEGYRLQHHQPEMTQALARKLPCWPGFLTVDPDWQRWNERLPKMLELGEGVPFNFVGKTWTRRTKEVGIALRLVDQMHEARWAGRTGWVPPHFSEVVRRRVKQLRPFSRETCADWWRAAEPVFVRAYGPRFEDRPEFAHYWKNAAYKGEKNARALIRRDIKARIKQAFRSLAPRRTSAGRRPG